MPATYRKTSVQRTRSGCLDVPRLAKMLITPPKVSRLSVQMAARKRTLLGELAQPRRLGLREVGVQMHVMPPVFME